MATLNYRDPVSGDWATLDGPTGPTGAMGPAGPPGPTVVSSNTGNTAVLGSDGLAFVPGLDTTAMDLDYVNLTGDTMTGELSLLDQVTVPPPVVPTAVAARGYVDQVITVSDVDPVGVPARDGLIWNVVEDVTTPPPAPPTAFTAAYVDATTNTLSWIDSA